MSSVKTSGLNDNWKKIAAPMAVVAGMGLAGCQDAADKASYNLSKAADNFEIQREVVFYNGITGHFFATLNGRCSIEVDAPNDKLDVTCKHAEDDFRKHFLGRSDNVTFFVLQSEPANVSEYNTRVIFNPLGYIPDIDFRSDVNEAIDATRPDTHGQEMSREESPVQVQRPETPSQSGGTLPELSGPKQ